MSKHALVWLILPILVLASETVSAQEAAVPKCVSASLVDYSELECTVNNLDFKFDKVTFARNPDPKTIQVEPVRNPDGLRFTLPAIPKSDDDSAESGTESVSHFFITFNPSFSYHVKALSQPIAGVIVQGRTPPRNENSGEPSRNTEMLFGPGAEPKVLEMMRLVLFDTVTATLSTPLAVGQMLKAGDGMTFVNEAGTPSFVFTNRFSPSK